LIVRIAVLRLTRTVKQLWKECMILDIFRDRPKRSGTAFYALLTASLSLGAELTRSFTGTTAAFADRHSLGKEEYSLDIRHSTLA
jgi:hypothetical protein